MAASLKYKNFLRGIGVIPKAPAQSQNAVLGDIEVLNSVNTLNFHNGTSSSQILTVAHAAQGSAKVLNKDLDDTTTAIVDSTDPTIKVKVNASGTTSTTTTLNFSQTVNRVLTFPDITDTVVTQTATQQLTNKTFNAYSAYFPPSAPLPNTALVYDGSVYKWSSAAGGDGSGSNDDIISTQYQARILDTFEQAAAATATTASTIDSTKTTATWDAVLQYYKIEYDNRGSATAGVPSTRITVSPTPAYPTQTVAVGDMLVIKSSGEARRITNIVSAGVYDIESAFSVSPSSAPCIVSETVSTFDIYSSAFDGASIASAFTATPNFQNYLVDYQDNTSAVNSIYVPNTTPVIAFSASNDIVTPVWSTATVRPTNQTTQINGNLFSTIGNKFFIRFFANPNITPSASGVANLLEYRGYMQLYPQAVTYSINQAYARLNGTGTPYGCTINNTNPAYTEVTLSWPYAFGTTTGLPYGAIDVYINGQFVPKFLAGVTTGASYTEVNSTTIRLDQNYGSTPYPIQIVQRGNI